MSAGKIRGRILVGLWSAEKPMTILEIAERIGLTTSSTMGYLLGLIKAKYVSVPQKHSYTITDLGKQAIGMPKLDEALAKKILNPLPIERAFHFYFALNQPVGLYADSLRDFIEKIQNLKIESIEFHTLRKDFEKWIYYLGDIELSKKLELLRARHLTGETLRKEIHNSVKSRCEKLETIATKNPQTSS